MVILGLDKLHGTYSVPSSQLSLRVWDCIIDYAWFNNEDERKAELQT